MYMIFVFKNEAKKLAHVMITQETATSNTLQAVYSKANWLMKKGDSLSEESSNHLNNAFMWMLINSKPSEWIRYYVSDAIEAEDANSIKAEITEDLKDAGYETTEGRPSAFIKSNSSSPAWTHSSKAFTAENTFLQKLKKFSEKCTLGLNISVNDFNKIIREAYSILTNKNGKGELTKYELWRMFRG